MEGTLIEGDLPEPKKVKPPRTHWDMLLERRTVEELEELLKERLDLIRSTPPRLTGLPAYVRLVGATRPGVVHSRLDAPFRDLDQRLANVGSAHLGDAEFALGEGDRHLDDDEPVVQGAPGQIDLEAVALGVHAVEIDRLEHFAAIGAVAGGDVMDVDAQRQPRIGVGRPGQGPAPPRPISHRSRRRRSANR